MEDRLRAAAIIQIVVGVCNVFMVSWLVALFWFSFGGLGSMVVMTICTFGLCPLPVGSFCAGVGVPIALLGLLEIVAGVSGLLQPTASRTLALVVAGLGLLSLLIGSPLSVVAGVVVFALLLSPTAQPPATQAEASSER